MNQRSVQQKQTKTCGALMRVVANTRICDEHVLIELLAPDAPDSSPGQFLQVLCRSEPDGNSIGALPLDGPFLRRPFSIADQWRNEDGVHIDIISRTVGRGTAWLERLAPGDTLNVTGPLGRGFDAPQRDVTIVLMGGGVGIPPLLFMARRLHEAGHRNVTVIFGAASRNLLPLKIVAEPRADGVPTQCAELPGDARFDTAITTDDGSCGMRGLVTDALRSWSKTRAAADLERSVLYACGPDAMLRSVADATRAIGMECQLSVERHMGCGLGTCLSCVLRVADASRASGWRWALACTDGPVFDRDELRCWE